MVETSEVHGVGPSMQKALADMGYESAEDIAVASPEQLMGVPRIGAATAPLLIAAAKALVELKYPGVVADPTPTEVSIDASKPAEIKKKKSRKSKKKAEKPKDKAKKKSKKTDKKSTERKRDKKKSKKGKPRKKKS